MGKTMAKIDATRTTAYQLWCVDELRRLARTTGFKVSIGSGLRSIFLEPSSEVSKAIMDVDFNREFRSVDEGMSFLYGYKLVLTAFELEGLGQKEYIDARSQRLAFDILRGKKKKRRDI